MSGKHPNQKGYIFITALIAVVILSIGMAVLATNWQGMIKRSNEEELIFRGEQYAEAIKRYFLKHKRYPFKLDELLETSPRVIRKLYSEPFSDSGEWGLIYLSDVQSGKLMKSKLKPEDIRNQNRSTEINIQPPSFSNQSLSAGQIVGVYSKDKGIPYRNFQKGEKYSDWKFLGIVKNNRNHSEMTLQN